MKRADFRSTQWIVRLTIDRDACIRTGRPGLNVRYALTAKGLDR